MRKQKASWVAALVSIIVGLVTTAEAKAEVPSLYLVQTSGWMEPFFSDPASPFKPLIEALIGASHSTETIIADFNQDGQVPGHRSPEVVYDGPFAVGPVHGAVSGLSLAVRPGGRLADSDFNGALVRSLDEILKGKPGIVWLITNNKNSRNNSPEINQNTRDFAEMIRSSPYLPFVVAYPVRMPVTGRQYTERGLIIYAIAYGDEAGVALSKVVDSAPMRSLFTGPPFKLKHLDEAPLVFSVTGAEAPITALPLPGGGVLLKEVSPTGDAEIRVSGRLRSDYYPQTIARADVGLAWSKLDGVANPANLKAQVEPRQILKLASGEQQGDVVLVLHTPAVTRPPGLAGLLAESEVLNGTLQLRLTNMSMTLGDDFRARMGEIAALDQLPDIFADYQRVSTAATLLPITLAVRFSPVPLILALSLAALVVILVAAAVWLLARTRQYTLTVEGRSRSFALRPMQSQTVTLSDNRSIIVTGRLFGRHRQQLLDASPKTNR